jgi:hypothetical protein
MARHDGNAGQLGAAVLRLFERAVAEGRLAMAEHLMQALEELANSEPACDELVERAYLSIVGDGAGTSHAAGLEPGAAGTANAAEDDAAMRHDTSAGCCRGGAAQPAGRCCHRHH